MSFAQHEQKLPSSIARKLLFRLSLSLSFSLGKINYIVKAFPWFFPFLSQGFSGCLKNGTKSHKSCLIYALQRRFLAAFVLVPPHVFPAFVCAPFRGSNFHVNASEIQIMNYVTRPTPVSVKQIYSFKCNFRSPIGELLIRAARNKFWTMRQRLAS